MAISLQWWTTLFTIQFGTAISELNPHDNDTHRIYNGLLNSIQYYICIELYTIRTCIKKVLMLYQTIFFYNFWSYTFGCVSDYCVNSKRGPIFIIIVPCLSYRQLCIHCVRTQCTTHICVMNLKFRTSWNYKTKQNNNKKN